MNPLPTLNLSEISFNPSSIGISSPPLISGHLDLNSMVLTSLSMIHLYSQLINHWLIVPNHPLYKASNGVQEKDLSVINPWETSSSDLWMLKSAKIWPNVLLVKSFQPQEEHFIHLSWLLILASWSLFIWQKYIVQLQNVLMLFSQC